MRNEAVRARHGRVVHIWHPRRTFVLVHLHTLSAKAGTQDTLLLLVEPTRNPAEVSGGLTGATQTSPRIRVSKGWPGGSLAPVTIISATSLGRPGSLRVASLDSPLLLPLLLLTFRRVKGRRVDVSTSFLKAQRAGLLP